MRLLITALLLCPWLAWASVPVPPAGQRVTDLTQTLSPTEVKQLAARLALLEHDTGAQVDVLLVPTTDGEDIAAFVLRVVEAWKPGRKKVDDGVVFVLAKNDRRVRIEVGYGLEGVIPDVVAKRILAEQVSPRFKEGHWAEGLAAGVSAMDELIRAAQKPKEAVNAVLLDAAGEPPKGWWYHNAPWVLLSIFTAGLIGLFFQLRGIFRARTPAPAFPPPITRTPYVPSPPPPRIVKTVTPNGFRASRPAPVRRSTDWPAAPVIATRDDDDDSPSRRSSRSSDNDSSSDSNSTSGGGGEGGGGGASDSF